MRKTKRTKKSDRKKDQFIVVLEDINHKFDILVEGQQVLGVKVDKLESRTGSLEGKMDSMENEVGALKHRATRLDDKVTRLDDKVTRLDDKVIKLDDKVTKLDDKMDRGFSMVFGYLSDIENELSGELKTKVSTRDFGMLEKRVGKLEKAIVKK